MKNNCPLCKSEGTLFYQHKKRSYFQCSNCYGIFVDTELRPDNSAEKLRYEEHNNDVNDQGYRKFVSPISSAIIRDFSPNNKGLDFGAGTAPVISEILKEKNYSIKQYDPFFHNYPELLKEKYDYIACCEVMEHFYHPRKEFELLQAILNENGALYCMTDIYDESINFHTWYYKNDPTHVFIYQQETIEWIKNNIGFSDVTIEGRLISFYNKTKP